ncbi:MAG: helix-turn-helix domain-containing protein [Deltaproteobacteria bacterium]|nr:helix-turn-helix domain-containing protein [Deltaproteobacteria bacterium]
MGVSYSDLIERMRWAGKLKNDSAVARSLGVTPQALSNYKKRGEMPTDLVLKFAGIYGLSVDWLITGDGEMYKNVIKKPEGEGKSFSSAAEDTTQYRREPGGARTPALGSLSPDEIICVGKLLKILRGSNKSTALGIKYSIDALLKASEAKDSAPQPEVKPETQG